MGYLINKTIGMDRSVLLGLFQLFLLIGRSFATGLQILPSNVAIFVDGTVDQPTKLQMKKTIENIEKMLPDSNINIGCIGGTYSAFTDIYQCDNGKTIDMSLLEPVLINEYGFSFSGSNRTAEINIFLVSSETKLKNPVPNIVFLKKTNVIQFGQDENRILSNMSSLNTTSFLVQKPEDVMTVSEELEKQLTLMSGYVCDTTQFCPMYGTYRTKIYTSCQCLDCMEYYNCKFDSTDVTTTCLEKCTYHPDRKNVYKLLTSPDPRAEHQDDGKPIVTIAVVVTIIIMVGVVVIVVVLYKKNILVREQMRLIAQTIKYRLCCQNNNPDQPRKDNQPINETVAIQRSDSVINVDDDNNTDGRVNDDGDDDNNRINEDDNADDGAGADVPLIPDARVFQKMVDASDEEPPIIPIRETNC